MTNGLVVMTPSSIAYSGTSASINADGSVVFSACSSLSLNGVFTSDYDNYMIVCRGTSSASSLIRMRLRVSGTDDSGANYTWQRIEANSTTVSGSRSTGDNQSNIHRMFNVQRTGFVLNTYGPFLTQPTAWRTTVVADEASASIYDVVGTHSQSSAYDGITLFPSTGSITGLVTVFGFNQ
jgi:hypothetical protein